WLFTFNPFGVKSIAPVEREMPKPSSKSTRRCLFAALLALSLVQAAKAEPLPFPPTYQRLVNDTAASVLGFYQQGNREGLMNIINRDPLIARKVLISLLRQPDRLEIARTLAELFPQSCESELEKPLWDFFLRAAPDTRKRTLDLVEAITDAEYAFGH